MRMREFILSTAAAFTLSCTEPTPSEPTPEQDGNAVITASTRASYEGIYLLGNSALNNIEQANQPFVTGYALRVAWIEADHGITGPAYDFSAIDSAIAQLAGFGKQMTLGIDVQLVPKYVLDAAQTTYLTTVPGPGHTTFEAETPVTWDATTLASYTAFMTALATHRVCRTKATCTDAQKLPLRDHPVLSGIRINILGMGKLRQTSNNTAGTIFEAPSYTRGRFIKAVLDNLHAAQDQFPAIPTWVPYFSVNDSISGAPQDPDLDELLIEAITAEFDGSSTERPVIGFFQELLKGDTPSSGGTNGSNLLAARAAGSFVSFQACGGWTPMSLCTFTAGDTTPENGFAFAYGSYDTRYYELYAADISNPTLAAMFTTWQAFFLDPATAANPVGLAARRGSTSRSNVLTWHDTSTLETSIIVERAAAETGPWVTLPPLAPNTVTYTDANPLAGTNWYRVHEVGTGGDLILSSPAAVTN